MFNWTATNLLVITNVINALVFFSIGYIAGQKTEKGEVYKYIIGTVVVLVWVYHVVISSQNASIKVSDWEHIMAGLVVWSLWGSNNSQKGSFLDFVSKIIGVVYGKGK